MEFSVRVSNDIEELSIGIPAKNHEDDLYFVKIAFRGLWYDTPVVLVYQDDEPNAIGLELMHHEDIRQYDGTIGLLENDHIAKTNLTFVLTDNDIMIDVYQ